MTFDPSDLTPTLAPKHGEMRLVIAAPDEVRAEREQIARIIEELNARAVDGLGINLCLTETPRTAGAAAAQLSSGDWDVFVGIVWLRFGAAVDPRDPDPRHPNDQGTEEEFNAACQATEVSGEAWPKSLIYRRTQSPTDLLSFDIGEYVRVQQFFASHSSITSPRLLIQHYVGAEEVEQAFHDQLARWIAEFAEKQAGIMTESGQAAENDARWGEAIGYYEQATDLFKRLGQTDSEQVAGEHLARAQRGAKQDRARELEEEGDKSRALQTWSEAQSSYEASQELARELQDREHQGQLLHKLGLVAADQELWSNALSYYGQAKEFSDAQQQSGEIRKLTADQAIALEKLGFFHYEAKNWESAADYYRQALDLVSAGGDRPKLAALHLQLGLVAEEQEQWPGALDEYDRALESLTAPDQLDQKIAVMQHQVLALEKVGGLAQAEENWYRAEAYYRDGVVVARSLSDSDREGELLAKLGEIAETRGQWRQALDLERQALSAFEQADKMQRYSAINTHLATVLEKVGDAERDQQRWERARSAYRESLSIAHESDDRAGEGELLYKLGILSEAEGQWSDSLDYFGQALPRLQELRLAEREADVLNHQLLVMTKLGDAARAAGNLSQAVTSYHQALVWAQHLADKPAQTQLLWILGLLSAEYGQWLQAVGYYNEALGNLEGSGKESTRPAIVADQAFALEKLADEAFKERIWERAESTYQQGMQLAKEGGNRRAQVTLLNKLGAVSEGKEQWRNALERYRQSLSMAFELGATEIQPTISENIRRAEVGVKRLTAVEAIQRGDAARADKQWEQAEAAYLESLALAEELENRPQEADLLHKLGLLSEDRAQWVDALTYYRKALPILTEQGARDAQVKVLWNIGRAQRGAQGAAAIEALEQGDNARASGAWQEAYSAYRRSLGFATQSGNKINESESLHRLGLLAAAQEKWQEGLDYYEQALSRLEGDKDANRQLAVKKDQAVAVSRLGDELRASRRWEEAQNSYRFSLDFARSIGDQQGQGVLLNQLGQLAADQEKWQDALGYYRDASEQLQAPESEAARRQVMRNQAVAFEQIGDLALNAQDWSGAEGAYRETIALAQTLEDVLAQGQLFDKLGVSAESQGLWDPAIDHYQQAFECFKKLGLVEAQGVVSENIERAQDAKKRQTAAQAGLKGDEYLESKQWDLALDRYLHALDLFAQMGAGDEQAEIAVRIERVKHCKLLQRAAEESTALANSALLAKQWDQAAEQFQQASDLFAELGLVDMQANMAFQIEHAHRSKVQEAAELAAANGKAALESKQWDEATEDYQQALDLFVQLGLADEQANMAAQIDQAHRSKLLEAADSAVAAGSTSFEAKKWAEAAEHFQQARDLFIRLGLEQEQSDIAARIEMAQRSKLQEAAERAAINGDAALGAKKWDEAGEHFEQASDLFAELGVADRRAEMAAQIERARRSKVQEAAENFQDQGAAALKEKKWDEAAEHFQQAFDLFAQLGLAEEQVDMADRIQRTQFSKDKQETGERSAAEGEQALAAKEWDVAESSFQRAADLFAELELTELQSVTTERIAYTRHTRQLDAAERAARQAAVNGDAALGAKQWDEASEHFQQALDLFAQIGLAGEQASMAAQIGQAHRSKLLEAADIAVANGNEALEEKEWDEAAEHYRQALDLFAELGLADRQASMADQIGRSQRSKRQEEGEDAAAEGEEALIAKEWDAAEGSFQRAAGIFAELELTELQTNASERLAHTRRARQLDAAEHAARQGQAAFAHFQWDQAIGHYEQAQHVYFDLSMPEAQALIIERIEQIRRAERAARLEFAEQTTAQGDAAAETKEWARAEEYYQRASALYSELALDEAQARVSAQLTFVRRQQKMEAATEAAARGDEAREAQNWQQAEEAYQTSLALMKDLENQLAQANLLEALGEVAEAQEEWDRAQGSYEQAMAIFDELEVPTGQMVMWRRLGGLAYSKEDWANALTAYQHSLAISREFGERAFEAQLLNDLGLLAEAQAEWDQALEQFRQALNLFTELNIPDAQALVRESIELSERSKKKQEATSATGFADVALAQENWQEALEHYRKAHSLFAELGEPAEAEVRELIERAELGRKRKQAEELVTRGDTAVAHNRLEEAETAYTDSVVLWRELGERERVAQIVVGLGSLAENQGQWENAQDLYSQAHSLYGELQLADIQAEMAIKLENAKREGKRQGAARAAIRGTEARTAGNWAEAESAYGESLRLTVELGHPQSEADLHYMLGELAEAQEHWRDAAEAYRRARSIFEKVDDTANQTAALEKVGDAHKRGQQWTEARGAYREALTIATAHHDRRREGDLLNKLGMLDAAEGLWEEADANYKQALKAFKELELHSAQTDVWRNIAHAERGAKSAEAAEAARIGDAKREAKNWAAAEEAYRHSMALSMEVGEHESEAWRWNDLGLSAAEQAHRSVAEENFSRALEIFQQIGSRGAQAQVWRNVARARQDSQDWNAAAQAYRESLAIYIEIGDPTGEAWRWNDLGLLAADQDDWPIAQEHYQHALDIFQESGSPAASTEVWRNLLLAQAGSYRSTLADAQEQGSRSRQGQLLNDLGLIAEKLDRWPEALEYYNQALQVFEALDLNNAQVTVWRNIGEVHRVSRHWTDAEAALKRSLSLAQDLGFRNSQASSLGLLGLVAEGREDWPEALAMHQAALAIFEELGDKSSQAAAFEKIGDAERGAQHLAQAEAAYQQALERARELNDEAREGHALNKLGMVAADRELWDEAKEMYRQGLLVFEAAELPLNQAQVLSNIGHAELGAHSWIRAREAYDGASSLYGEVGDGIGAAWAAVDLARLQEAQCLWAEATKQLEVARQSFQALNRPVDAGTVLKEMARASLEAGELAEAESLAQSALEIFRKEHDDLLQAETLRLLAAVRFDREEINEAQEQLEQAVALNPRNHSARVDLGVALLFPGAAGDAIRQFNACLDQGTRWKLKARIGLALCRHSINDSQGFRAEVDKTKALIVESETEHSVHRVTLESVKCVIEALESKGDAAVAAVERLKGEPPLAEERDAYRYARLALLLLSRSPRRLKSRGSLTRYFKASKTKRASGSASPARQDSAADQDQVAMPVDASRVQAESTSAQDMTQSPETAPGPETTSGDEIDPEPGTTLANTGAI